MRKQIGRTRMDLIAFTRVDGVLHSLPTLRRASTIPPVACYRAGTGWSTLSVENIESWRITFRGNTTASCHVSDKLTP